MTCTSSHGSWESNRCITFDHLRRFKRQASKQPASNATLQTKSALFANNKRTKQPKGWPKAALFDTLFADMNICLVGSMRDIARMQEIAGELKQRGHQVILPMDRSETRFADRQLSKREFMENMFENIKTCESVLAVNDAPRTGYNGYIGPNTFLQLGMAMALKKPLFCLQKWDDRLPYAEELNAMNINTLDLKSHV